MFTELLSMLIGHPYYLPRIGVLSMAISFLFDSLVKGDFITRRIALRCITLVWFLTALYVTLAYVNVLSLRTLGQAIFEHPLLLNFRQMNIGYDDFLIALTLFMCFLSPYLYKSITKRKKNYINSYMVLGCITAYFYILIS